MTDHAQPNNEWMIVYTTAFINEAHVIAGRLEHEGIPCWIHQPVGGQAFGFTVGSLGTINVLVHPKNYDAAYAILYDDAEENAGELPDFTGDQYISGLDDDDTDEE